MYVLVGFDLVAGVSFAVGINAAQESALPNHSTATLCLDVVLTMWTLMGRMLRVI